jgi:hypothetical protein
MPRLGTAVLALLGLIAVATMLVGCNGFFVSPGSVATITVSPTAAVLATGGGTLPMAESTTLVNGNPGSCTSTSWATSDTTGAVITIDPSSGVVTPVGAGTATVTGTCDGTTSSAIPIEVIAGASIGTVSINLSTTSVPLTGGSVTASVVVTSGQLTIPTQYVSWTFPSGTGPNTLNTNNVVVTFPSALTSLTGTTTTATLSAIVYTNGNQSLNATSASITY